MRTRRRVFLTLALLLSFPAFAFTWDFDHDGVRGILTRSDDGTMGTEARITIDRSPETVVATLTDYDRIGEWMPSTKEYRVVSRTGANARYYRSTRAPFFLPSTWAMVDATVGPTTEGRTRVEWHRVEGTVTTFDASFDVEPSGAVTQVTYRVRTSLPFPIPDFVLKRLGSRAIAETLTGLRDAARSRSPK